jgi:hypothetical protein
VERHCLLPWGKKKMTGSEDTQEMLARPSGKVGWKEDEKQGSEECKFFGNLTLLRAQIKKMKRGLAATERYFDVNIGRGLRWWKRIYIYCDVLA